MNIINTFTKITLSNIGVSSLGRSHIFDHVCDTPGLVRSHYMSLSTRQDSNTRSSYYCSNMYLSLMLNTIL